ncbi:MAG: hypothetical protein LC746_06530 [Acidobacteria bacterium]|nr:hypothetical protein [Acidobacteriota bacterium]
MRHTTLLRRAALAAALAAAPCASARAQQPKPADHKAATQTPPSNTTPATEAKGATTDSAASPAATALPANATPVELARAAVAAQGGDKWRALKNIVLFGTAVLYSPGSTQSLAGKFYMVTAGDRVRLQVESPIVNMTLVSDSTGTYTSIRGFQLPPASRFGVPVLMNYDQPGYAVAALNSKKKERAFRITEPEGMITDFYLDAATGRLVRFEVPYGPYTYGVEIKAVKDVDGVPVPTSFVQRISTGQGDFFAEFKVKEAKLNQELPADIFTFPKN